MSAGLGNTGRNLALVGVEAVADARAVVLVAHLGETRLGTRGDVAKGLSGDDGNDSRNDNREFHFHFVKLVCALLGS